MASARFGQGLARRVLALCKGAYNGAVTSPAVRGGNGNALLSKGGVLGEAPRRSMAFSVEVKCSLTTVSRKGVDVSCSFFALSALNALHTGTTLKRCRGFIQSAWCELIAPGIFGKSPRTVRGKTTALGIPQKYRFHLTPLQYITGL